MVPSSVSWQTSPFIGRPTIAPGLQRALRAINAKRDFRREWDFDETLKIGDAATGVTVLTSQYETMRNTPVEVDLAALWSKLGVVPKGDTVAFDEAAPLVAIRKAITSC